MKKLLVIALAAMLVLSFAAVSMAAVAFSGEVKTGYNFIGAGSSINEAKLKLESKVSDTVTAKMYVGTTSTLVELKEAYFIAKTGVGDFNVGRFEYKPYAVGAYELNILSSKFGKQKDDFAIGWGVPGLPDGAFVNVNYVKKDGKFFVDFGYVGENWGANYVYFDETLAGGVDAGYVVNAYIEPIENLMIYGTIEDKNLAFDQTVLGAKLGIGNAWINYEYDMEEYAGTAHASGWEVGYAFNNKVEVAYTVADDYAVDTNQELTLKVKFK